jgi:hypothetical protein
LHSIAKSDDANLVNKFTKDKGKRYYQFVNKKLRTWKPLRVFAIVDAALEIPSDLFSRDVANEHNLIAGPR